MKRMRDYQRRQTLWLSALIYGGLFLLVLASIALGVLGRWVERQVFP